MPDNGYHFSQLARGRCAHGDPVENSQDHQRRSTTPRPVLRSLPERHSTLATSRAIVLTAPATSSNAAPGVASNAAPDVPNVPHDLIADFDSFLQSTSV